MSVKCMYVSNFSLCLPRCRARSECPTGRRRCRWMHARSLTCAWAWPSHASRPATSRCCATSGRGHACWRRAASRPLEESQAPCWGHVEVVVGARWLGSLAGLRMARKSPAWCVHTQVLAWVGLAHGRVPVNPLFEQAPLSFGTPCAMYHGQAAAPPAYDPGWPRLGTAEGCTCCTWPLPEVHLPLPDNVCAMPPSKWCCIWWPWRCRSPVCPTKCRWSSPVCPIIHSPPSAPWTLTQARCMAQQHLNANG